MSTTRAIVLARGLGTRMRADDPAAVLSRAQQQAADAGLKAMIPLNGRPFLDYILSSLADAGIDEVGLVVAPHHQPLRDYYRLEAPPVRLHLEFIVQPEPLGTADAVAAAAPWIGEHAFLTVNGDNLYPAPVLQSLAGLHEPGLPGFDRDDLIRTSNIPADRLRSFAFIEMDEAGYLTAIVEKPEGAVPRGAAISMNCWRFDRRIFDACREVPRSPRGEFEIPLAVALAVRQGVRFRTFRASGPVLDLSTRADAADVAGRLAAVVPSP